MSNSPFSDEFIRACAQNCLDITDVMYSGWPRQEVIDTLTNQGNLAEADAISESWAIVHGCKKTQTRDAVAESKTPIPSTTGSKKAKQLELNLYPALPAQPEQTPKQELNASTAITTLPSIVSRGYIDYPHSGMNWPNNKNIWTLCAIALLFPRPFTEQQKKDMDELKAAVEEYGNKDLVRTHHTAQEIVNSRSREPYIKCGLDTIRALAKPTPYERAQALSEVRRHHLDTRNKDNAARLTEIIDTVKGICSMLRTRYKD